MTERLVLSEQDRKYIGVGSAFGIIVGAVVFAVTGNALGLGLGIVVGAMAGAAFGYTKKQGR